VAPPVPSEATAETIPTVGSPQPAEAPPPGAEATAVHRMEDDTPISTEAKPGPTQTAEAREGNLDRATEIRIRGSLLRPGLPWYERAKLEKEFHDLRQRQHGGGRSGGGGKTGWSLRDTAEELGRPLGALSEDLKLADAVHKYPSLKRKHRKTALRRIGGVENPRAELEAGASDRQAAARAGVGRSRVSRGKTGLGKHIHKYQQIKYKPSGYTVYKCMLPNCPHFIPIKELVIGRPSICWRCGGLFTMSQATLLKKPHCPECKRGRREAESETQKQTTKARTAGEKARASLAKRGVDIARLDEILAQIRAKASKKEGE